MNMTNIQCGRCAGCAGQDNGMPPMFCLYWREWYTKFGNIKDMLDSGAVFTTVKGA